MRKYVLITAAAARMRKKVFMAEWEIFFVLIVCDDLPGTAGARDAARLSVIQYPRSRAPRRYWLGESLWFFRASPNDFKYSRLCSGVSTPGGNMLRGVSAAVAAPSLKVAA